jgi:phage-related baseplate assembly protein
MATAFTSIDLSQLKAPDVVEAFTFETILAAMLADLRARDPSFTALVESDPAYKVLEVAAYRETLLRQRVNEAGRAVMLAYAANADLDQIGANYSVQRLVLDEGDADAVPPVPPTYETDDDFRKRIQLSFEGYTSAGSEGSYIFHGLGADGNVKDVAPVSPAPGQVTVYVLSRTGNGAASPELLATVAATLNADTIRPMTDQVTVQSAAIVNYTVQAELVILPGPDPLLVRQAAVDAIAAYCEAQRRIGYDITLSGVYAALHQPGVQRVNLAAPSANLTIGEGQASYCTSITVTVAGATSV